MGMKRRGALSRMGASAIGFGELISIVRETSFDDLRDEAQIPPRLLLLHADRAMLAPLREALGGPGATGLIETAALDALPQNLADYDGIVLVNATPSERARPEIKRLLTSDDFAGRTLTFQLPPPLGRAVDPLAAPSAETVSDLRRRLLVRLSHRQLALGRWLPAFRREAATTVINATARANAEFALLSNIPAVIPIVGGLMAAASDTLVLTKNQLFLIYKLAAIHGRDLDQPWRIYSEMLPVVGAGLFWRTVARELASFVPLAGGTIPKVLIAYTGTAVTGQAANFYYEMGQRPSREQWRQFYQRAAAIARTLRLPARDGRDDAIEARFSEQPDAPTTSTANAAREEPPTPAQPHRVEAPSHEVERRP